MTKRDIAALLCKAVSLYIFSGVITMAPLVIQVLTMGGGMASAIALIPVVFQAVIAVILWTRAASIAARMAPETDAVQQIPVVGNELQGVVFAAVGLFFTVEAVLQFVDVAINLYVIRQQAALLPQAASYSATPEFLRAAVKLAFGLWLLLATASVLNLVASIRRGGVDAEHRATTVAPHD